MKYIDATTTAEKISDKLNIPFSDLCDIFAEIPSEDVQPVKHGRWSLSGGYVTTAYGTIRYQICSVCGANLLENDIDYNYCPICGARMDLKENNDA